MCIRDSSNRASVAAHTVTMAEILESLDSRVDVLLVATSTTGTIGGLSLIHI